MNSPPPLSAQHPRSRHHVVPISVPPRIHPAHAHRSNHQHGPYPTSAFPTGYHTGQPVFLNPYLTPGFLPLPIMPHAIPISGRIASSFGFVRPPASAFPYPGYAPVQHVHHHHYHHRPPPSSDPAFVPQEGVNPSFNASGRAFPSRQAWERHSGQASGNRPQVFDPDGYPIPHDMGDEGPVVVDANEGESAAGMEMVLHQLSREEMQYHGSREEDTDMHRARTHGASPVPQSLSSGRHYRDGTAQVVTRGTDTDTPSAHSVRIFEQDVTPSIVMQPETANTEIVDEHNGEDSSDDQVAEEERRHGQMTKSLYERTNADPEINVGDQRRTQSLHAVRLVSASPAVSSAIGDTLRDRGDAAAGAINKNASIPSRSPAATAPITGPAIVPSFPNSPAQVSTSSPPNSATHLPTSTEMIDRLLLTTGLNARQFMRMLEDQTFVLDVERYQRKAEVDPPASVGRQGSSARREEGRER